jgi:putative transposase
MRPGNSSLGWSKVRARISLQKFASVHATVSNHFTTERGLSSRSHLKTNPAAARAEWRSPRAV